MPTSMIDALSYEIDIFSETVNQLVKIVVETSSKNNTKQIQSSIDDMENILLIAATNLPVHITEKMKTSFSALKSNFNNFLDNDLTMQLTQIKSRLLNQTEQLTSRFMKILQSEITGGNSSNGIILAQEEERKRISREIHDGPAQTLASLTMRIDYCLEHEKLPEEVATELYELKDSIGKSLKDIRRFIFDLRPMALDDLGLIPTLEQFITGFKRRTGIPVHVDVTGERTNLSSEKELSVFRVIQEASNNAAKHAEPKSIHIFLSFQSEKNNLSVVIKDDGKGFDVAKTKQSYGSLKKLGLISMEERIRLANGEIEIVSSNSGTVVSFLIPTN